MMVMVRIHGSENPETCPSPWLWCRRKRHMRNSSCKPKLEAGLGREGTVDRFQNLALFQFFLSFHCLTLNLRTKLENTTRPNPPQFSYGTQAYMMSYSLFHSLSRQKSAGINSMAHVETSVLMWCIFFVFFFASMGSELSIFREAWNATDWFSERVLLA